LSSYERFDDPYCYLNSPVLKNRAGIKSTESLEIFEVRATMLRASEPLPSGKFGPAHYRAIHRHLFQDVYDWAGAYRTIRIAKGHTMFCFPEHIAGQMDLLFASLSNAQFLSGATATDFIAASAQFLADLNAIHAFRDGNGRTQLTFLYLLGDRAGLALDMTRIRPQEMLSAMIASFGGKVGALEVEIALLCSSKSEGEV
jgi:cell filamentation protein